MKKKLFFMPFLAAALFSCSEKGLVTDGDGVTNGDSEISYLSVNIVSSQETGTRAAEEFKVGSEAENKVNSIRFYFFAKDGKAAAVKGNGATYYDVSADEITNDYNTSNAGNNQNIESTVSAVIVIESPKGDDKPYYVAAVVNPTPETPTLTAEIDDVTKLQETVKAFSTTDGFVMSSSVYKAQKHAYSGGEDDNEWKEGEGDMEYIMVPVYGNIKKTRLEALENKATIYVERVLAKVSVSLNFPEAKVTNGLYNLDTKIDKGADSDNNAIYAKFLGWNVTATRKTSRLVKKIDIDWPSPFDAGWGSLSWNDDTHYRSYWAINPPNDASSATPIETYYNFGNFSKAQALPFVTSSTEGKYNYTYLQENAGKNENGTDEDIMTSKIIVAAQLVDKNGTPLELVEWGGNVYKKDDDLMTSLAQATGLYVVDETKGSKDSPENGRYTQLSKENISFYYAAPGNADAAYDGGSTPKYYVSIQLAAGKKYAIRSGNQYDEGDDKGYGSDNVNVQNALNEIGKIKYWNTGYTYYWVDIKHLGGDVTGDPAGEEKDGIGKYGVVRNHWYDYTFTSVNGLGVPVPDPNETIYPETPNDPNLFYLAAEIKILSWRMVQHNDEGLGWD